MASPSSSINYWRKFFRSATSDIFQVIEQAILVAASDHPEEFRSRRDQIMEKLYTALLWRCDRCNRLQPPGAEREEGRGSVRRVGEESKVSSTIDDLDCSNNPVALLSNCAYDDETEALARDIEEEDKKVEEILQIKEILHNKDDESDDVLLESLRRLQEMEITVDVLKSTEVGKAVTGVRKCKSNQIRQLARTIVEDWKVLVDEWINANAAITDKSLKESQDPSPASDGGGLLSPSLDEGRAPLAFQTSSVPLTDQGSKNDDEKAMKARLEIAKRKLHQGYQQAENAKKQRTIQTIELPDVPKQASSSRSSLKIKIPAKLGSTGR